MYLALLPLNYFRLQSTIRNLQYGYLTICTVDWERVMSGSGLLKKSTSLGAISQSTVGHRPLAIYGINCYINRTFCLPLSCCIMLTIQLDIGIWLGIGFSLEWRYLISLLLVA